MTHNKACGDRGEQAAVDFLQEQGYEILERNWRYSRAEVDIIAAHGGIIVFLEVKTRASHIHGFPEDFVDRKKQLLLSEAASKYLDDLQHEGELRFDVISVTLPEGRTPRIRHVVDAFFPGLFG